MGTSESKHASNRKQPNGNNLYHSHSQGRRLSSMSSVQENTTNSVQVSPKYADSVVKVLVIGETGSGKNL